MSLIAFPLPIPPEGAIHNRLESSALIGVLLKRTGVAPGLLLFKSGYYNMLKA
jgi:hypothetical protein